MVNLKALNYKINEIKTKFPKELPLIEAIQQDLNANAQILTPIAKKALLTFPIQYVQKIRTSDGEWTTQLHTWADHQVPELLRIDPIILTTHDSNGDCVLKRLVMAACGLTQTQIVNYKLIEEMLGTDMNYQEVKIPGDTENTEPGNAWYERDMDGKTVFEYLYSFAEGEGEFEGRGEDVRLLGLIDKYAESALATADDEEETDGLDFMSTKKETEKIPEEQLDSSKETEMMDEVTGTENQIPQQTPAQESDIDPDASPDEIAEKGQEEQEDFSNALDLLVKLSKALKGSGD